MPIRNPFTKRHDLESLADENNKLSPANGALPAFERVDTVGSKSSAISINSGKSQEPAEYKMSGTTTRAFNAHINTPQFLMEHETWFKSVTNDQTVVNDSGVYLPPSPPEKKGFWPRRSNPSSASTNTTNSITEIEPFSISRESFDSYRRSFDISAKSPIIESQVNANGRQSLDSARLPRLPRSAINERRFEREPPTTEEGFEDVGLNDDQKQQNPIKKKGLFSRFGESDQARPPSPTTSLGSKFHITGRKRGQSGQGAELGSIERPSTANRTESPVAEVS